MPSLNATDKLVDLFTKFNESETSKEKAELLARAKLCVFNEMSDQQIVDFFSKHETLESMFALDCWSRRIDRDESISFYTEPYDIVERVLECFKSFDQLFNEFNASIMYVVEQAHDEKVKHLVVKHLIKLANQSAHATQTTANDEQHLSKLLAVLVHEVPNTGVAYSQLLTRLICHLTNATCAHYSLKEFEANTALVNEVKALASHADVTIYFRMLEMLTQLACVSKDHLTCICRSNFEFDKMMTRSVDSKNRDVLARLNSIELLVDLVRTEHGYEFFVVNGYASELKLESDDPFSALLAPAIIKLYSAIARKRPSELHTLYPAYFDYLFACACNEDLLHEQASVEMAYDTFTYLFESNVFKKFMFDSFRSKLGVCLARVVWLLKYVVNEDLRVSVFKFVAYLIAADPDVLLSHTPIVNQMDTKFVDSLYVINGSSWSNLANELYDLLVRDVGHENLFNLSLTNAKKPFMAIRLSAQLYFKALAQTKRGLEWLFRKNKFNSPVDFIDGYLLNRSIELEKEGLESKYELVRLIVTSLTKHFGAVRDDGTTSNASLVATNDLMDNLTFNRLREYVRQGPFYSLSESRVAFESS